jgi:hypothetical protein
MWRPAERPALLFDERLLLERGADGAPSVRMGRRKPPAGCWEAMAFSGRAFGEPANSSPSWNMTSLTGRTCARARSASLSAPAPSRTTSNGALPLLPHGPTTAMSRTPRSGIQRRHRRRSRLVVQPNAASTSPRRRQPPRAARGRLIYRGRTDRVVLYRLVPPTPPGFDVIALICPAGGRGTRHRHPMKSIEGRPIHGGRHPPLPAHHLRPGQSHPREPAPHGLPRPARRDPHPRRQIPIAYRRC